MEKNQFISLVNSLILPLFAGAEIIGEEESTARDYEVAGGPNGTMLVKLNKSDDYRLIIKRNQPFKNNDITLVKSIIIEFSTINELLISDVNYIAKLRQVAIEKCICNSLSENSGATVLELINEVFKWSERTYEGKNLSFGFVVNESVSTQKINDNLHFSKFLRNDFSALLSDGKKSVIELDKNGYIVSYPIFERQRVIQTICPQAYVPFAKYCSDKKIGVAMLENGDMLLFKNHMLMFAKRRGIWNSYNHEALIDLLSNKSKYTIKEIRKALYITALDVSYNKSGGCIVYLNKDMANDVLAHINLIDILTENHFNEKKRQEIEESEKLYNLFLKNDHDKSLDLSFEDFLSTKTANKSAMLSYIIGNKKFHELNRKLREELVSMDGATIVDYDGSIIAVGAIIKIEAGSTGGGRLAATKTLSRYGIALKISTDGIIQGFTIDRRTNLPKPIFSIG